MPELPEVETVRRTLEPLVIGRTFTRVVFDWRGCDAQVGGRPLDETLPNARCVRVGRRGKYLLLHLTNDRTLVIHLRMTGRIVVIERNAPAPRHQRAALEMDNGRTLVFADQRKFGRLALAPDAPSLAQLLRRLGPEPIVSLDSASEGMSAEHLSRVFAGRRASVKAVLLDQRAIAGLGNIYVDETLFLAKVHPATPAGLIGQSAAHRIASAIVSVLTEAVADGGTTLADYRDAHGERGSHQHRLQVFRRDGQPCRLCGTTIQRSVVAQRGTHACPTCQPL
jgi:formamidopyrimidine-DNA glycosylase